MRLFLTTCLLIGFLLQGLYGQSNIESIFKNPLKSLQKLGKMAKKGGAGQPSLRDLTVRENACVMATEPSYLLSSGAYLDHYYNLLTDLIIGEYDINLQTGAPRSADAFRAHLRCKMLDQESADTLTIIEKARRVNPRLRILLQVASYGDFGSTDVMNQASLYEAFLNGGKAQDVLIDSLKSILTVWTTDFGLSPEETGIVLDLQQLPLWNKRQESLVRFIRNLRQRLLPAEEGYRLYLKLPYISADPPLYASFEAIDPLVDLYILQGNYFSEPMENAYGEPPFESRKSDYYLNSLSWYADTTAKTRIAPSKLVVEYALYGSIWQKSGSGYRLSKDKMYAAYSQIREKYPRDKKLYLSDAGYSRLDVDGVRYYFYDSLALAGRFAQGRQQSLAGVALLGPGYIKREEPLPVWGALAAQYGQSPVKPGWAVAGFLFLMACFGFPYAVYRYWEVRNILARFTRYLWYSALFCIGLFLGFLLCFDFIPRNQSGLLIAAVILGFFALLVLLRKYISRLNRYLSFFGFQKVNIKV